MTIYQFFGANEKELICTLNVNSQEDIVFTMKGHKYYFNQISGLLKYKESQKSDTEKEYPQCISQEYVDSFNKSDNYSKSKIKEYRKQIQDCLEAEETRSLRLFKENTSQESRLASVNRCKKLETKLIVLKVLEDLGMMDV